MGRSPKAYRFLGKESVVSLCVHVATLANVPNVRHANVAHQLLRIPVLTAAIHIPADVTKRNQRAA
jgi:hypothetical protein